MRVHPDIDALDREAHAVATMICSEAVPDERIEAAVEDLRRRCDEVLGPAAAAAAASPARERAGNAGDGSRENPAGRPPAISPGELFDRLYGLRLRRLRARFRPVPSLFGPPEPSAG